MLRRQRPSELKAGDILKFGVDALDSDEFVPACTIQVDWAFDHLAKAEAARQPGSRSASPVPTSSDSGSSEEDDSTEEDARGKQ